MIEIFLVQIRQMNSALFDHLCHLTGGQTVVHILETGVLHLRTVTLEFLGGTGHQGNGYYISRVDTGFFSIVSFEYRTEHLLGRFTGGQMVQLIREEMLAILDPAW